jgi:hypothetical protein
MNKIKYIILFISVVSVFAQEEILPKSDRTSIQIGGSFQAWKRLPFVEPIQQISFHVMISLPMSEQIQLSIQLSPAISQWNYLRNDSTKISGNSDTWIECEYVFPKDRGMVQFGIGLPTGKTRLNNNQIELAQYLSRNLLRYQLPIYGQGLCLQAAGAYAYPISDKLIIGIGSRFTIRNPYHPVTYNYNDTYANSRIWDVEYKPGNELSGNIGIDVKIGDYTKLMVDVITTYFGKDQFGLKIYDSGIRTFIHTGLFHQMDQRYFWVQFLFRQKGKNELQGISLRESNTSDGNQYEFELQYKLYAYENGSITLLGDERYYEKNDQNIGGGNVYGFGIGASVKVGESSEMKLHIKYLGGIIREVENRSIQGVETGLALILSM